MNTVDIHLVSWNRPKMTELMIKTIKKNTDRKSYRLVIWDNGSGEEAVNMLERLKKEKYIDSEYGDKLILNGANIGLEAARQRLLGHETDSEYFICADNDCLPQPRDGGWDWIRLLDVLMNKYENYAAISCRTQIMIGTGNIFEQADENRDDIVDFPHPGGSLRIMRTDKVREVGGWDKGSDGRGAEERYICGKLRGAGYGTAFASRIFTQHLFGTRGEDGTDRWGYQKDWPPEKTGHSDIWHPALANGDDFDEVAAFAGEELAKEYFGDHSNNKED